MRSPYEFTYRNTFPFDLTPQELWTRLSDRTRYAEWWTWMRDLRATGEGLEPGATFTFKVVSPLPYRMVLTLRVIDSNQPEFVAVSVDGHLRGDARLDFREVPGGSDVDVAWDVEVIDRAMRVGARLARPAIKWGQDWAVRKALATFRRHLESSP